MSQPMQQQTNSKAEAIAQHKRDAVISRDNVFIIQMDDMAYTNGKADDIAFWRRKQFTAEECLKQLGNPLTEDFYRSQEAHNILKVRQ